MMRMMVVRYLVTVVMSRMRRLIEVMMFIAIDDENGRIEDEYDCVDEDEDEDGDYSIPKNNDNENELISMRIEKI